MMRSKEDPVTVGERLSMSYHQQQEVRRKMKAHDDLVASASSRVDTRMNGACELNLRNRNEVRCRILKAHAQHPEEPLSLYQHFSYNTRREWRLNLDAHHRRCDEAITAIDDRLATHAIDYRHRRDKRRKRANRPASAIPAFGSATPKRRPPSSSSRQRTIQRKKDPFDLIMNAWPPIGASADTQPNLTRPSTSLPPARDASFTKQQKRPVPRRPLPQEFNTRSSSASPSGTLFVF